jgi:hypothetical protein
MINVCRTSPLFARYAAPNVNSVLAAEPHNGRAKRAKKMLAN